MQEVQVLFSCTIVTKKLESSLQVRALELVKIGKEVTYDKPFS